jgi:rhodanese-related sulfurtransferase
MKKNYWIFIILALIIVIVLATFLFFRQRDSEPTPSPEVTEIEEEISEAAYKDVNSKKAYQLITEDPQIIILDVSSAFNKGHLPKAINHYVGDGSLDEAIPDLDKNKTYLVYCHVDSASISGAQKLVDAGFKEVYRLEGNYSAWYEGGYPIEVGIKAVGKYSGSALATRSFLDGKFSHSVEAELADPASGKFYEGWLVRGTSFFSTGKMTKEEGKYFLNYESNKDSRDYKEIVITEETEANGLDGKPEAHVLEGEFE